MCELREDERHLMLMTVNRLAMRFFWDDLEDAADARRRREDSLTELCFDFAFFMCIIFMYR